MKSAVDLLVESRDVSTAPTPAAKLEKTLCQWLRSGNSFKPVGKVVLTDALPAGAYNVEQTFEGIQFTIAAPSTDGVLVFEDSPMHKVVSEIDKFWDRKEAYDKLGLMHNRGILLYGPPGTGKSLCLQQVVEATAKRGDVIFFTKSAGAISSAVSALREVEPDRRVVVAFEEADELARYDESQLLRLMDGDGKVNKCLFLGTTNYLERMSPRMLRPGRFDRKVMVGYPTYEQRLKYLTAKAGKVSDEKTITEMAKRSEGMGFGHLRELIAGVFAIGDPLNDVLARLRGLPVQESGHFDFSYAASKSDKQPVGKPTRRRLTESGGTSVDRLLS